MKKDGSRFAAQAESWKSVSQEDSSILLLVMRAEFKKGRIRDRDECFANAAGVAAAESLFERSTKR